MIPMEQQIKELAAAFAEAPWVVAAYLFGSHAQGRSRPGSDVDIGLVLSDQAPDREALILPLARVEAHLADVLEGAPVHLVILNEQGVVFQHSVLRTGQRVFEGDRLARVRFEARVVSEYCDFLPTLRWFERFHAQGRRRRLGLA